MSETRTNVEIEDVLSSIRRLVSQDGSHAPRPSIVRSPAQDLRAPRPVSAAEPECLVLTPSLRVAEPPRAEVFAHAPQPEAALADAVADSQAPDAPPEAAAEMPAEMPAESAASAQDAAAPEEEGESLLDAAWQHPADPAPDLGAELSQLETTIAELEAAVSASGEEFEPEQGHPFAGEGLVPLAALHEVFETDAGTVPDAPEAGEHGAGPGDDGTGPEVAGATVDDVVEWVDPVAPELAELTADDWAEDEGAAPHAARIADENGPRRLHLADAATETPAPQARRTSYQDIRAEAEEDALDADDLGLFDEADEAVIDEEALRALVSEFIRQELQGALGERITRNVRKLVRREIQRALASRDFE
jgi:hypothetical protein